MFEFKNAGTLEFLNSELTDFYGTGIYLETYSGLVMTNSVISSNSYVDGEGDIGTGIYCYLCDSFNISSSRFDSLYASISGGAIMALPYTTGNLNSISDSNFTLCNSSTGGALFLDSTNIKIARSYFQNNSAAGTSSTYYSQGGAIFIEESGNSYINLIDSCVFSFNYAGLSGGAIQWYSTQPSIVNSSYVSNSAYYGANLASFAYRISVPDSRLLSISNIPPGQPLSSPIVASVLDHYNQTVSTDDSSTAQLTTTDFANFIISGQSKVTAKSGTYTFADLTISGPPGSQTTLQVSGDFASSGTGSSRLNLTVGLRDCLSGEATVSNMQCEVCPTGSYSLVAGSACKTCPTGAVCYGGNQIVAASGYWRASNQSDVFFPCPNSAACMGESLNSSNETCSEGYQGNLCQTCKLGYSRDGDNYCTACLDKEKNAVMVSGMAVVAIVVVVGITATNVKGAYKEQSIIGIYFKILMTYFQIVMLTISFNLNWPTLVIDMFSAQSKVGGSSDQLFSIDCFIGASFKPYYAKLILLASLPAICALCSLLFWLVWGKIRKSSNLKEKIIGSIVVQLFFFQPSLVKYNFSMFNCMELAPGQYYMTEDMSIQCWESEHLVYTFALVIPSLGLWCTGIPLILLYSLLRNQQKITEIEEKLKYGFLYKGFKPNRYYWEFLTMLRKMLIICTSVFLRNVSIPIQALLTFLIILGSYILQEKFEPYTAEQLNKMEMKSIIVSSVTIYAGMFFLTDSLNDDMKLTLFVLMVLSNITFLTYWIYYTFGFYIGKIYISLKCCRKLFGNRLHPWIVRVLPMEDVAKFESESVSTETITITETRTFRSENHKQYSKFSFAAACQDSSDRIDK